MANLTSFELPIRLQNDSTNTFVSDFAHKCRALKENLPNYINAGFAYRIGEDDEHSFTIKVQYRCYISEGPQRSASHKFTENKPFITLLLFDDNLQLNGPRIVKRLSHDIIIDQSGELNLYNEVKKTFSPVTISWIMEQITDCISDSEAWEVLYEQ